VLIWLLLIPAGLFTVFAYVGLLSMTRGTAVRHVRGVGADGIPVGPHEPQFPASVTLLTGAVLSPGNLVEVSCSGEQTCSRLWQDLRSARHTILLQLYYGQPGRMADQLCDILVERARAGVRVFVLYDAFGAHGFLDAHLNEYRRAGILTSAFRPLKLSTLHLWQNRAHVRGIVVDSQIAWTGGFGIDDKWLGDGRTKGSWRETNVRFEGPAVRQMQAAFATGWTEATGVLFTGRVTATPHPKGVTAGLLYTTPALGSTTAERFMAMSIAGAAARLYLTNAYFAPDRNFVDLLVTAAQRGVDVRILTAGKRTDVNLVRLAGRANYDRLLSAGVRIYEWRPTMLHAKTFVVDGTWSSIGSMNFDNRSLALNDEATLMVLDDAIGAQMEKIFLDDVQLAEEVTLERFRRRSRIRRLGEPIASLMNRLL
jgi:cardiolipin synthase